MHLNLKCVKYLLINKIKAKQLKLGLDRNLSRSSWSKSQNETQLGFH